MKYCLLFPVFLIFTAVVYPQIPGTGGKFPPSLTSIDKTKPFVSLEGKFSIALPKEITKVHPIASNEGIARVTGLSFSWSTEEAEFGLYFAYKPPSANNVGSQQSLELMRGQILKDIESSGGKLVAESSVTLGKVPGHEFRAETPDMVAVFRLYLTEDRVYEVILNISKSQAAKQDLATRTLDSFKILDDDFVKAAVRKKIDEVTPAALPQSPMAKKFTTDARDQRLKGKVKMITEEDQDLSDTSEVTVRVPHLTHYYNEIGNLIKEEIYDRRGNPSSVITYGYIDNHRVKILGKELEYEYQTGGVDEIDLGPGPGQPKYDKRYTIRFEYKYDGNGMMVEKDYYQNTGSQSERYVYNLKGGTGAVEELHYVGDSLHDKTLRTIDSVGDERIRTYVDPKTDKVLDQYRFSYEYDSQGNWIKREALKWSDADSTSKAVSITYRTISYY